MRTFKNTPSGLLTVLLSSAILSACGGGGGSDSAPAPVSAPSVLSTATTTTTPTGSATAPASGTTAPATTTLPSTSTSTPLPPSTTTTVPPPPPPPSTSLPSFTSAEVVTNVHLQSTSAAAQQNVPVTFGQVFSVGHIGAGHTVAGKLSDGTVVPLQVDVKARHADGSIRHAIVSTMLGTLSASQTQTVLLEKVAESAAPAATTPTALLDAGFTAVVHVDLAGQRYSASADALLRSGQYKTWLSGPIANEWQVSAPLTTEQGTAHPHLTARFAIRAAHGVNKARVDVTIENAWAYEAAPQNFLYDAQVVVGGQSVYTKAGLNHYHHARWRKVFWWGGEPAVHVRHNVPYLLATRALPNFDQSVVFTETKLNAWKTAFSGAKTEPMAVGLAAPYMPATGGRDDIGLMPAWAATYLLSQDKRAKDVTMGTADLAGSWSSHYRNKTTDRPISLFDFPYMTIAGQRTDTMNPVTKKLEAFPLCATSTSCTTPNTHDSAHQPAFAYLPYLVTGDYYYLEELQFWAMWNTFMSNPGYRENIKGLVNRDQVRAQAWSLRTIAEAAYITPDADPLKSQLDSFINNNLDWYNNTYTNNAAANSLGIMTHASAIAYDNATGVAPWMDDFFTSAVGHVAELGYAKATPLLLWKSKFPISRMIGKDTCWVSGAMYQMKVRDSSTGAIYTTIGEAFAKSTTLALQQSVCGSSAMATLLGLRVGEMTGYSGVHTGYPSNMQPALAYSADAAGTNGTSAWTVFMARSIKPNYGLGPQFAIVPR